MVRTTLDHLSWALRNFSWYLATLSACIGVAVAVFTVNLARIGDLLASMLSTMAIQEKSTGQVVRGVDWVITLTWALLGFLLAGSALNVVCKFFVSRTRDQFRRGAMLPVGCCGWSLVHTSRVTLNVLHAVALTATFWLALLLCTQGVALAGFGLLQELATQASTFSDASSTKAQFFASETSLWLQQADAAVTDAAAGFAAHCETATCAAPLPATLAALTALRGDLDAIQGTLTAQAAVLCPAAACMNLRALWFLGGTGCLCDQGAIDSVRTDAAEGLRRSKSGAFFLLAALVCALLHLSKVAMNLKSLIKDDHWMRRVRKLVNKLSLQKGMCHEDSIFDTIYGASLSNYPLDRSTSALAHQAAAAASARSARLATPLARAFSGDPQESDEIKALGAEIALPLPLQSNALDGESPLESPERRRYRFEEV